MTHVNCTTSFGIILAEKGSTWAEFQHLSRFAEMSPWLNDPCSADVGNWNSIKKPNNPSFGVFYPSVQPLPKVCNRVQKPFITYTTACGRQEEILNAFWALFGGIWMHSFWFSLWLWYQQIPCSQKSFCWLQLCTALIKKNHRLLQELNFPSYFSPD